MVGLRRDELFKLWRAAERCWLSEGASRQLKAALVATGHFSIIHGDPIPAMFWLAEYECRDAKKRGMNNLALGLLILFARAIQRWRN
jgi:hypothetical protein